ncbi:MAG: SDR family oxidoreductase [Bryobacterales bacterium]
MIDVTSTFAGKEILLTGGNGFLGKVILGMLLDRYPEIGRVHVLLRPRRDRTARERFQQEVLESPALRELVKARGRAFLEEKIEVWEGDAATPSCGLDPGQIRDWEGKLALILNSAGLVEFFPPVNESLHANVESAEQLAALAKRLDAALLHISTCYVAGRADGLVEESEPIEGFYPLRQSPSDDAFDAAAELSRLRSRISEIGLDGAANDRAAREQLIELGRGRAERWGWVNTYTFTKSLAEQVLVANRDLRLTIVRPAIVESSLEFPFPGWVEGGRTAAPLVLMALGGMANWPARSDLALEIVPVDMIAAGVLTAAAALLTGEAAQVYHLATADRNPFEMEPLLELLHREARRRGARMGGKLELLDEASYRARITNLRESARKSEERLSKWAEALDGMPGSGWARNRAADLRRAGLQWGFREDVIEQYLPFVLQNRYIFEAQNIRETHAKLSPADREKLPWKPQSIDWPRYWRENQIEAWWVQPETVREWSFQI